MNVNRSCPILPFVTYKTHTHTHDTRTCTYYLLLASTIIRLPTPQSLTVLHALSAHPKGGRPSKRSKVRPGRRSAASRRSQTQTKKTPPPPEPKRVIETVYRPRYNAQRANALGSHRCTGSTTTKRSPIKLGHARLLSEQFRPPITGTSAPRPSTYTLLSTRF